ncbi:MAG: hypothetical protein IKN82_10595 [Treponema sp.]|nr:hypothetical protein [Treponema sp.]
MNFKILRKNIFASLALCLAFALFSCTNEVSDNNVVGFGYQFPEATGISRVSYSQVYNEKGEKQFTVVTFNLQGWEDIPFIRLEDVGKFMNYINDRGYNYYLPPSGESVYKCKYYQDDAGTVYPVEWKDDTLYFDVKNQTIYSDDFTRMVSPKDAVNNGIGNVYAAKADAATKSYPKIDFNNNTTYVKAKERTTIDLKAYGLKMFVFDTTRYNSKSFNGYENDLLVPFQVIADTFLRYAVCSFNGFDYYVGIDATSDQLATTKAYDSGRFVRSSRSQLKAEYNYRNLCLLFDKNYCLKERRTEVGKDNIGAFINDSIFKAGLGFDLLSTDTATYDTALEKFLMGYIDDGHTVYHEPSMYQSYASISQYKNLLRSFAGPRIKALNDIGAARKKDRAAAAAAAGEKKEKGVFYVNDGNADKMAVIVFDNFLSSDPGNSTNLEEIAGLNTYWFLTKAFEDIATHTDVKNVVIDLSCNGGGVIQQCMLALCFLRDTDEFFMAEKNHLDNSIAKFYYSIDTGSATSLKKNYNFYVLTSGYSFSCGNFFPAVCHYQLGVPIVGQKSGGGGGVVKPTQTSDGALFQTSASAEMCAIDASGNYVCIDAGVPVDLEVPYDKFYSGTSIYKDLYEIIKADPRYAGNFN